MGSNTGFVVKLVNDLGELVTQLLKVDVAGLPATVQVQCLEALRPVVCQFEAVQLRLVGAIDAQGAGTTHGSASTAAWLRNSLRVPNATAMVQSAAALATVPKVAAALAAGEIGDAHVATIARVIRNVPPELLATGVEDVLVAQARKLPPSKFGPVAARIRDQVVPRPDKPNPRRKDRAGRWLRVERGPGGHVSLAGRFEGADGELVADTLKSAIAATPDTPAPDGAEAEDLESRQARALVDLCRRVGSSGCAVPDHPIRVDPRWRRAPTPNDAGAARRARRDRAADVHTDASTESGDPFAAGRETSAATATEVVPGTSAVLPSPKAARVAQRHRRRKRHRHSAGWR